MKRRYILHILANEVRNITESALFFLCNNGKTSVYIYTHIIHNITHSIILFTACSSLSAYPGEEMDKSKYTLQTFNSCISRPSVCQCLVVHTPMDNISKGYAKLNNDPRKCSLRIKSVVRPSINQYPKKNWWQSVVRSCIIPGLPTHAVQE